MTALLNGLEHHPLHAPIISGGENLVGMVRRLGAPLAVAGSLALHVSLAAAFALGLARAGSEALHLSRPDAIAVELVRLPAPPAELAQPLPPVPQPQIAAAPPADDRAQAAADAAPRPNGKAAEAPPEALPSPAPVLAAAATPEPAPWKRRPPVAKAVNPPPHHASGAARPRAVGHVTPQKGTGVVAARPPAAASSAGEGQYKLALARHVARFRPDWSGRGGAARVLLTISRSGRLSGASVVRSSGQGGLDSAILAAARRAQPYPAPPTGYTGGSVSVSVTLGVR